MDLDKTSWPFVISIVSSELLPSIEPTYHVSLWGIQYGAIGVHWGGLGTSQYRWGPRVWVYNNQWWSFPSSWASHHRRCFGTIGRQFDSLPPFHWTNTTMSPAISDHIQGHNGTHKLMTHLGKGPLDVLQSFHYTNCENVAADLLLEPSPELSQVLSLLRYPHLRLYTRFQWKAHCQMMEIIGISNARSRHSCTQQFLMIVDTLTLHLIHWTLLP